MRGALDGGVTDEAGERLGTVDRALGIERTSTASGSYTGTGDGGQFFLDAEGAYEGSWTAADDGEVRFIVRGRDGDEVAATATTWPFVVRTGATISLDFENPADLASLELRVDDGGDGSVDRTVPFAAPVAGAGASDRLPPVSRIAVEHVDAAGEPKARITITATDSGGAGVGRVEYGLSTSDRPGVYTGPFEVPAVGRITVRAIDRAGNIQAPYARASLKP